MRRLRLLIALLVLLLGRVAVVAQPKKTEAASSISITGNVEAQGKPVVGAFITLWQQPFGDPVDQSTVATALTDTAGNYELKNIPTGNYFIGVRAPGFVTGKENDMLAKLRFVTVVGANSVGPFNFELVREGVITGIVTDADGKPLRGIPITLKTDVVPNGAGPPKYAENIRTDDQGRYRVAGMPAGKYRIAAGHWPLLFGTVRGGLAYPRIFYPNAIEEAEGRIIEISAGTEVNGIDFTLGQPTKTFTVRARILDERTGKPIPGLDYSLGAYLNGKRIGGRGPGDNRSNDRGEIILPDIPPGEYSIIVPDSKGVFRKGDPQTPNYNGQSKHFEVVDKDVADIQVLVTKGASVAGVVVVEGPAGADVLARVPEMILTGLVETNPMTPAQMARATIRPDGSFLFTGLRAGTLKLNFLPPATGKPLPLNFARIERDGGKLEGDLEIQLGEEVAGLKVVMIYANSSVHGFVKLDDGSFPPGLIGIASVAGNVTGNRSVINQNGEFILQNLVAGEYKLVVVAHDAKDRHWQLEQTIKIEDDQVSDAKVVLDSKVKPNPTATQHSYLKP